MTVGMDAEVAAVRGLVVAIGEAVKVPEPSEDLARLAAGLTQLIETYQAAAALRALSFRERRLIELRHGLTEEGAFTVEQIACRYDTTEETVREALLDVAAKLPSGWSPAVAPKSDVNAALSMIESAVRTLNQHQAFQSADPVTETAVEAVRWRLNDAASLLESGDRAPRMLPIGNTDGVPHGGHGA